jgi:hypothetical protein
MCLVTESWTWKLKYLSYKTDKMIDRKAEPSGDHCFSSITVRRKRLAWKDSFVIGLQPVNH